MTPLCNEFPSPFILQLDAGNSNSFTHTKNPSFNLDFFLQEHK